MTIEIKKEGYDYILSIGAEEYILDRAPGGELVMYSHDIVHIDFTTRELIEALIAWYDMREKL